MKKLFRILLIISTLTYIVYLTAPYFDKYYLDQGTRDLLQWTGYQSVLEIPNWLLSISSFFWLPLAIGLWFFNSLVRKIYLIYTLLFLFLNPLLGLFIASGFEMFFFQATTLLDGVILTMAYFTSLDDEFKNT